MYKCLPLGSVGTEHSCSKQNPFPLKTKSEAHEAVSIFLPRDGVPNTMVMDGANEQTLGDFRRKCREASCNIKQTEPHSPWMNMADNGVRELKKASAQQMLKTHSPKPVWDHCLELQAFIKSHTAGTSFGLNGETPETMLTRETADISEFAQFGWYDWVKFRDTVVCIQRTNWCWADTWAQVPTLDQPRRPRSSSQTDNMYTERLWEA